MPQEVLVIPGTGAQGRAACTQLKQKGFKVRALARNPSSDQAQKLEAMGIIICPGDLDSIPAIEAAMKGVHGVYFAPPAHPNNEKTHANNVANAARATGVKHFIYSSVARAGDHENFPGWGPNYPLGWYWTNKADCEEIVRSAGFETWTILRPAFFSQNFELPICNSLWPGLADKHEIRAPWTPETTLDLIDVQDIGKFAVAAFTDPSKFNRKEISLAGDRRTLPQLAELLSTLSGKDVTAKYISDAEVKELVQQGHLPILALVWQRETGYQVDVDAVRQYGILLNTLEDTLVRDGLGW